MLYAAVAILAATVLAGLLGWRRTQTAADFFVAGRACHPWTAALSFVATYVSLGAFVGLGSLAGMYDLDFLQLLVIGLLVGAVVGFAVVGPFARGLAARLNAYTFPELLGRRFQSRGLQVVLGLVLAGGLLFCAAAVILGGSALLAKALTINRLLAAVILCGVVGLCVVLGGLRGMMYASGVQSAVMVGGVFVLIFACAYLVLHSLFAGAGLPPEATWPKEAGGGWGLVKFNSWWKIVTGISLGVGIGVLAQPQLIVPLLGVRDHKPFGKQFIFSASLLLTIPGSALIIGSLGQHYLWGEGTVEQFLPGVLAKSLPEPWLSGLAAVVLVAASISVLASQFQVLGSTLGRDVLERLLPGDGNGRSLKLGRLATVLGILAAAGIAWLAQARGMGQRIADALPLFFQVCGAAFLPALVAALFAKKIGNRAAVLSILGGLLASGFWAVFVYAPTAEDVGIVFRLTGDLSKPSLLWDHPNWPSVAPFVIGLLASAPLLLLGARWTRPLAEVHRDLCFPETPMTPEEIEQHKVGTLTYTKAGLFLMFFWILWGDLCWSLMEAIQPQAMPLQLRRLGIPKAEIGMMNQWLAFVVAFFMVPIISFRSDRTRTRWGRRIPYIAVTMPFLCLALGSLGFAEDIGGWLRAGDLPEKYGISPYWFLVAVIGVMLLTYDFLNMFVNSVFYYLFADVIPKAFMGRFAAAMRLVGTLVGALFSLFVIPRIETHTKYLYLGMALLYFFGLLLMLWKVKEGKYPPPEDYVKGQSKWKSAKIFFRESFTHPLYLSFFLFKSLWAMTNACNQFKVFYTRDFLKWDWGMVGKWGAVTSIISLVMAMPVGWVVDKLNPMRCIILATLFIIPQTLAGAYYDYWGAEYSFYISMGLGLLGMPFMALFDAADMPLMVQLLPRAQYGQFAAANSMMRSFTYLVFIPLGAVFIDYMNTKYGDSGNRYAFFWQAGFMIPAFICLLIVHRYWKHYGGDKFTFSLEEYRKELAAKKAATAGA